MVTGFNNTSVKQGKNYTLNTPVVGYEPLKKMISYQPIFSHPLVRIFNLIRDYQQDMK